MKRIPTYFIITILLSMLLSCNENGSYRTADGGVWNTTYHISYHSERDLTDTILAAMREVELSLSPFNEKSLITAINHGDTTARADFNIRRVFEGSLKVNGYSHGAFDPTVAPLVNLWGFGYKNNSIEPTQEAIDSLLLTVGLADCAIDTTGIVRRKHPTTEFNFSAITKGYGCDRVGEALRRNGVEDYMVEIGGEIAALGKSARGSDWRIMIDAPIDNDTAVVHERMAVIAVTDCGVATSGNYRNYKLTPEGKIWHTISPVTGRPAETDLLSATIVAPTCMMADAMATACMAMSAGSAMSMLESTDGVEGLLVTADTILVSSKFPEIMR